MLFKLQQMQKVDVDMLDRLLDRFAELDEEGEGALDIGTDVPSAEQVKEMQRVVDATGLTLPEYWRQMQPEILARARQAKRVESGGQHARVDRSQFVKLNKCHDFAWSRKLWKEASRETGKLAIVMVT